MAFAVPAMESEPLSELNTTPLIDVMLVLLVMFIITIPLATHSVEVDLPQSCQPDCPPAPDTVSNKIVIDAAGRVLWNGATVTETQLAALLAETTEMAIEPELQFEPEANASYDVAARTLRTIKASGVSKFGFVGNEKYRQFGMAD
ncbi:ExbD/TolR family protein [Parerythrobacter lacustris]|uniref:ExbD/TolR family protein n=1 Tax=Parerythrobacter lacustris TaxID=2969984 RepID=UPI003F4FE1D3